MQERSLLDYWLILYRRHLAIYAVIAASVASSLLITWLVPPTYEARAALYIPAELRPISYVTGDAASTLARRQNAPLQAEDAYKPYVGILKSVQLAQLVSAQYPKKEAYKLLRSDVDFEVTDQLIVRVYARDSDPVLAANVANAYVSGLNRILAESSQAQVAREPEFISSALQRVRDELKEAENQQKRFEEKYHIASLQTELTALSSQKSMLQEKLEDTLQAIASNRGKQIAVLREIDREGLDLARSDVATTSPVIEHLRRQLADQLTRLGETEVELGPNNLTVITARKRKEELEHQLSEEVTRWLTSQIKPGGIHIETLRQQLIEVVIDGQRLEAVRKAYEQSISRVNERLRPYPEIKARWAELNQNTERIRSMQQQLRVNLAEAKLQIDRGMDLVVPLDRAEPPTRPAFPIWWLNLLVALFAGVLAGIGYAFFLEYVEETRDVRTLQLVRAILDRT